jgi:glutathione S-transferase
MKLIGPWFSPFTRRVGISLNLLKIPYEHVPLHAFNQKAEVKAINPMGKVPVLILDDGTNLIDSSAIADYLDERVGVDQALIPKSGRPRQQVLQTVARALAVIEKASAVYYEKNKTGGGAPAMDRTDAAGQTLAGLGQLEQQVGAEWMFGERPGQADITTVVAYQTSVFCLDGIVNAARFPKLNAFTDRAMEIPAFSSTLPQF